MRAAGPRKKTPSSPRPDVDPRAILDAASSILSEEGPAALSMRRVATAAGVSTMVLYTRFGSREGLVEQLLIEGFTRFANELGSVSHADAFEQLSALGRAYRRFALVNPTYYPLMWAARGKLSSPSAALVSASNRSFGSLVFAITRVLGALDRSARDVEPLALSVWATVHGFVSLELAGVLPPGQADLAFEQSLLFIRHALVHPVS